MNSNFTKIVRIALGLMLLVFGANKFFQFYKLPLPDNDVAKDLIMNLEATEYFFLALGLIEIIFGIMLLIKKWVPFALIALFPIAMNIVLFHILFSTTNMAFAVLVATLDIILIYKYWEKYKPLFD